MAKKIESTPVLTGEDADIFLRDMAHPEIMTEEEKKLIKLVKKTKLIIK